MNWSTQLCSSRSMPSRRTQSGTLYISRRFHRGHTVVDILANYRTIGARVTTPRLTRQRRLFRGPTHYRVGPLWRLLKQVRIGEKRWDVDTQLPQPVIDRRYQRVCYCTINMSPANAKQDQIRSVSRWSSICNTFLLKTTLSAPNDSRHDMSH